MGKTVFISYAASDPDWPSKQVEFLASDLKAAGHDVKLDTWEDSDKRKKSDAEWREWMRDCIDNADCILCLASARYKKLSSRDDFSTATGRGVAYESSELENLLYRNKQNNFGLIWIVAPNSRSEPSSIVPVMLSGRCPVYFLSTERNRLIRDVGLDEEDLFFESSDEVEPESAIARIRINLYLRAKGALSLCSALRSALHARLIRRGLQIRSDSDDEIMSALSSHKNPEDIFYDIQNVLSKIYISEELPDEIIVPTAALIYLWACLKLIEANVFQSYIPKGNIFDLPKAPDLAVVLFCEALLNGDLRFIKNAAAVEHPDYWDVTNLPETGPDQAVPELERDVYMRGHKFGMLRLAHIEAGHCPDLNDWKKFQRQLQRTQEVHEKTARIILYGREQSTGHVLLDNAVAAELSKKSGLQILRAILETSDDMKEFMEILDDHGQDFATEIENAKHRGRMISARNKV